MPEHRLPKLAQVYCPRCRQPIELSANTGVIQPHRDTLVSAPCPMRGRTLWAARDLVDRERSELGLPPMKWE